MSNLTEYQERHSAFQRRIRTFAIITKGYVDIKEFFGEAFDHFKREIEQIIELQQIVKLNACLKMNFTKTNVDSDGNECIENQTIFLHSKTEILDTSTDLTTFFDQYIQTYMVERIDDVMMRGSGFTLSQIDELLVQVNRFDPIAGSSYIELPKFLQTKKAIINIKNDDNQCFKYAVLSALFPVKSHAQLISV